MSWQRYNLAFQLLTPLHVGWRKVSNLQQPRGYVTGKVFWAALTARLTREAGRGAMGEAYQAMGKFVQHNFRFTYLYPALLTDGDYKPHYPWEDDFDYLFLDSYASAALNYPSQSAADGLLHETECITPRTRSGQAVYLTGSLYVQENLPDDLQNWQAALDKLQFGGERGYGWGRVKLLQPIEKERIEDSEVQVNVADNGRSTAHLIAAGATNVLGPIEPYIGWEQNNRPNRTTNMRLAPVTICYAPGAAVSPGSVFIITENGLWRQLHHS